MSALFSRTLRVLLIADRDDDFHAVASLLSSATRLRFEVERGTVATATLDRVRTGGHDAALLVEGNGDAAREFLRATTATRAELPVILLDAMLDAARGDAALQAGAVDCLLLADLRPGELERTIQRALRHAALGAELQETRHQLERTMRDSLPESSRDAGARLLQNILRDLPVLAGQLDASARVVVTKGAGLLPQVVQPQRLLGRVFTELFPQSRVPIAEALAGGASSFVLTGQTQERDWHVEFFVTFDRHQRSGATFLGRDITDRRWLELSLLRASDAERQQLGADLHDDLGQQLAGLAYMAGALRDRLKTSLPHEAPQADALAQLARGATAQSRSLARGLHPVQFEEHGLIAALEELALHWQERHGIACGFQLRGSPPEREHWTELHLYRIAQEAIQNAVRHSGAKHVRVTLAATPRAHWLSVADDGCGFELAQPRVAVTGRGLRLMQYRTAIIGGEFSIRSRPDRGTRIACLFPNPSFHENESSLPVFSRA